MKYQPVGRGRRRHSLRLMKLAMLLVLPAVLRNVSLAATIYPVANWQSATPAEAGFDPVLFQNAMNSLPAPAVVIKSGKLVGSKGTISATSPLWSGSKSITALIGARLMQQGHINYDTLVPNSDVPTAPLASYRQFMSMTSDFQLNPHNPGEHYAYSNNAVAYYGIANEAYFPGMDPASVIWTAFGSVIGLQDPIYSSGPGWNGGLYFSTRDLARIGYLILRDGNWNGTELLPASFVSDLYTNQISPSATMSPDTSNPETNEFPSETEMGGCYSFGFWIPRNCPDKFGPSTTESIAMWGSNATTVYISRSADLVIATVNSNPSIPFEQYWNNVVPASVLDAFANAVSAPDNTPPIVSITTPSQGAVVNGSVRISANASDNQSLAGVQFKVDGNNLGSEDTNSPNFFDWNTISSTNGPHNLSAVARDSAGNLTTSEVVTVTVNNVQLATMSLNPTTLSFTAGSSSAPVAKNSALSNTGNAHLLFSANPNQTWCHVNPASETVAPGNNRILSVSVDSMTAVGNFTCTIPISAPLTTNSPQQISVNYVVTDATPPAVTITAPANGSVFARRTNVTITATASDNVAVTKVEFYVDNSRKCTDTTAPYSCVWQIPNKVGSSYTIQARGYDAKNNIGTSTSITLRSQ